MTSYAWILRSQDACGTWQIGGSAITLRAHALAPGWGSGHNLLRPSTMHAPFHLEQPGFAMEGRSIFIGSTMSHNQSGRGLSNPNFCYPFFPSLPAVERNPGKDWKLLTHIWHLPLVCYQAV